MSRVVDAGSFDHEKEAGAPIQGPEGGPGHDSERRSSGGSGIVLLVDHIGQVIDIEQSQDLFTGAETVERTGLGRHGVSRLPEPTDEILSIEPVKRIEITRSAPH
jgi:hypothetical protein